MEISKKYDTIQTLVETEIKNGFAKDNNSHCRNLVRLKRVINLVRECMERLLEHGWYVKPWTFKYIYYFLKTRSFIIIFLYGEKNSVFNLTSSLRCWVINYPS